jgi:hypothetical protein
MLAIWKCIHLHVQIGIGVLSVERQFISPVSVAAAAV